MQSYYGWTERKAARVRQTSCHVVACGELGKCLIRTHVKSKKVINWFKMVNTLDFANECIDVFSNCTTKQLQATLDEFHNDFLDQFGFIRSAVLYD